MSLSNQLGQLLAIILETIVSPLQQLLAARPPPGGGLHGEEKEGNLQPDPREVGSEQLTASPTLEQEDALAESKDARVEPPRREGVVQGSAVGEEKADEKEDGGKGDTEKMGGNDAEVRKDMGEKLYQEEDKSTEKEEPSEEEEGSQEGEEEEEEDEEGWITPDNLQRVCEQMGGLLEEEPKAVAVGCLTSDFAMQVRVTCFTTEVNNKNLFS